MRIFVSGYFGLDGGFDDFDASVIGDFDNEAVVFYVGDGAVDAACGEDVIASGEGLEHFSVLFLFFALGGDEKEPHAAEEEDHDDELATDATCATWSGFS